MSRGASPGRATPYLDAWKAKLEKALDDRGSRSELARWLAERTESTTERWKVQLAKVLNTPQVPDGEFVLAVNNWLEIRAGPANKKRRR